ncbi:MAG: 50S ribosomal protein L21 [Phycisphaerales bacterium]
MYAIIEESGSQRWVKKGDELLIDLAEGGELAAGKSIKNSHVLVVGEIGGTAKVGAPYVSGAHVSFEVIEGKELGEKVHIQKFREKKAWKKKTGHRQPYTRVRVTEIKG